MLNFKLYKLNIIHLTVQPKFDIIHYRDVPYIYTHLIEREVFNYGYRK